MTERKLMFIEMYLIT